MATQGHALKILLIDDDEDDYLLVRDLISDFSPIKFRLQWESDFLTGLNEIDNGDHDVCLLDYQLGDRNGLDLLREAVGRGARTPIVFLTGHGDLELDLRAMREGAVGYLTKNQLNGAILERSIRSALEQAKKNNDLLRAKRVIQTLSDCNTAVIRTREERELLSAICRIVVEVGGYRMAWVGYANREEDQRVVPMAVYGHEDGYLGALELTWRNAEHGRGPAGRAINDRSPNIVRSIEHYSDLAPWRSEALKRGYSAVIAFPLFIEGHALGALAIYSSEENVFDHDEVELLGKLADNLSYGIEMLRSHQAQKEAEAALAEVHKRLDSIMEVLPDATFVIDHQGRVISWNRSIEEMSGVPKAEMIQKGDYEHALPFYGQRRPVLIDLILKPDSDFEAKQYDHIQRNGDLLYGETFAPGAFGGRGAHLWSSASLLRDSSGHVVGAIQTMRDVTAHKRVEAALRESEERLRIFIEHAPASLAMFDHDMRYLSWSRRWIKEYNLGRQNLAGLFHYELFPEIGEELKAVHQRALAGEVVRADNDRFDRWDGSVQWLRWEVRPWHNAKGEVGGIVIFSEDISEKKIAEVALENEISRRRILFEQSKDGIVVLDHTGKVYEANQSFADMLGYSLADVHRLYVWDWDTRWSREELEETLRRVDSSGDHFETLHRRKDGSVYDVEISTNSALIENQKLIFCSCRDVTERKQAQEALRQSQLDLNRAQAVAHVGSWRLNVCRNELIWSDESYRIFGIPKGSPLTYETYVNLVHPEDRGYIDQKWAAALQGEPYDIEHRILVQDSVKWVQVRAEVEFNLDGSLRGGFGTVQDITGIKNAEAALRASKEEYAVIFDQSPIAIELFDLEGELVMVNQACLEMFGVVDRQEIIGFKLFEDPNVDLLAKSRLLLGEEVKFEAEYDFEKVKSLGLYRTTKSGKRFLSTVISPIRDGSHRTGYIMQVQDITERRRAEEERGNLETQLRQAQKMEAIGTLAGGIAHDFNNILSAVIGYSDLALTELSKESPVSFYIEQIQQSGFRARDLVKQILAFSRQTEQEKRPLKMSLLVKETVKLLRASIPSTVEIRTAITARSEHVFADATQMHQVIMNLCTNAWQAMREEGGILGISLRETRLNSNTLNPELGSSHLEIEIKDTGCGIPPQVIERIFDPYFTTKPRGEGTGLGLAVVQGIVKSHGGVITVESTPGAGATFRVFLPLLDSGSKELAKESVPIPLGKGHILYVDDELMLVDVGKAMLERLGYRVTSRVSSEEALDTFRADPDQYDLVITDYAMPKMSGIELAGELIRIRPCIPILMCTGFSEEVHPERLGRCGIKEVLLKPIISKDLALAVRRVLDLKDQPA